MSAKTGFRGLVGKLHKTLMVALVLVVLFSSLPIGKAYAWSYANPISRPGAVSVPPAIYIGDLMMPWGSTAFTLYGSTGPVAYRSPGSSGAQIVGAQYFVQTWNGSRWVNTAQTGTFTGQISASQTYYRFPAPYIQPLVSRGTFRVMYTFVWTTTAGATLGATNVLPNLKNDHICVTTLRLCQTSAGYFQTGGYRTGTW